MMGSRRVRVERVERRMGWVRGTSLAKAGG